MIAWIRVMNHWTARLAVLTALALITAEATAQSERAARRGRRSGSRSAAAAMDEADQAAGHLLDSLFSSEPPADPLADAASSAMGAGASHATRRSGFQGTLVHNPDQSDGNPPYALADSYGGIARFIEPVSGIDLEAYVGSTVAVRRDTGQTLLASQLDLPRYHAGNIELAQHMEELPPGAIVNEGGEVIMPEGDGPIMLDDGLDFPQRHMHYGDGGYDVGCSECGSMLCPPGGCGFGARPIFYARGDYMMMWAKGMQIPPMVVRGDINDNGTPTNTGDDFIENGVIVYGNEEILKGQRNGGRVTLGYWFDDYGQLGIEGEYFELGEITEQFTDGGDGTFFVGRPYTNIATGADAVQDVSFTDVSGTVTVDTVSRLTSTSLRLRRNLCCVGGCGPDCGDCVADCGSSVGCGSRVGGAWLDDPYFPMFARGRRHVDFLAGIRWMELDENLRATEDLVDTSAGTTTILLMDNFATNNEFVGGEVGFVWDWSHRRWSLEVLSKLALGNNRQQVVITGSTVNDRGTALEVSKDNSGLLAQPSNVGAYERNVFTVIPELGVTLGYDLTQRLRFNVGYNFIYWGRVVRPGDQIDLDINEGYLDIPAVATPNEPERPQFEFRDSDFWVQGVTLGFLYQY